MSIFDDIIESINNLFADFTTDYEKSTKWKEYHLGATISHCIVCLKRNNKIYSLDNVPKIPEHDNCACYLDWLRKVSLGSATKKGFQGADYYITTHGKLPNYYITKEEATAKGWKAWLGNLDKVAPGKMIGGDIFSNREEKLPNAPNRVWYECDIDYNGGYRNNFRLIYSNDGLIFKTDSHYTRFIAVE